MANIGDLPEDILLELLSLLPAKDLILNCRPVCHQWRDLVDSTTLWKLKLKFKEKPRLFTWSRSNAYYALSHLEKNLIKNPCGEEGLEFWEIVTPEEEVEKGQWEVQEVSSLGNMKLKTSDFLQRDSDAKDTLQHEVNKCFAPSNGLCIKSQHITLKDHGYWDQLMDENRPTIVVTDWFLCSSNSRYQMSVKLLGADMNVIREYTSDDKYETTWETEKWHKVSHTFYACPPGIRHILFQHQGQNVGKYKPRDRIRITKSSITIGPYRVEYDDYDYSDYNDRDCYTDSSDDSYSNTVHFGYYGYDYGDGKYSCY